MGAPPSEHIWLQIVWLLVLAIPIATIAWTVTHEEVFREPRDYCRRCFREAQSIWARKFFYLFTCEYCFSHWVTLLALLVTGYRLLLDDWRGYVISFFALVGVANVYMSIYNRVRLDIKTERVGATLKEHEAKRLNQEARRNGE
jgi:hypothetical protein